MNYHSIRSIIVCFMCVIGFFILGAEEKMNVELIVPIGAVVIAMFFWLLIVFVIRNRKRVIFHFQPFSHTNSLNLHVRRLLRP